jgi:hypothetical protein
MELALVIALGVLIVSVAVVCAISAKRRSESFRERFSAISDAEFMARCTPGTDPKVALRVRRIVADCLGVDYERVYPSSRFVEDLGAG